MAPAAGGQKIRIRLRAYDHEVIDQSTKKIVETVIRTQAKVQGPVPLPTEIRKYCVIRSPHKHKDSREHFEMRIHKRLLDIVEPTGKTVESLQRLDLPAGVDIEIKIQQLVAGTTAVGGPSTPAASLSWPSGRDASPLASEIQSTSVQAGRMSGTARHNRTRSARPCLAERSREIRSIRAHHRSRHRQRGRRPWQARGSWVASSA